MFFEENYEEMGVGGGEIATLYLVRHSLRHPTWLYLELTGKHDEHRPCRDVGMVLASTSHKLVCIKPYSELRFSTNLKDVPGLFLQISNSKSPGYKTLSVQVTNRRERDSGRV